MQRIQRKFLPFQGLEELFIDACTVSASGGGAIRQSETYAYEQGAWR